MGYSAAPIPCYYRESVEIFSPGFSKPGIFSAVAGFCAPFLWQPELDYSAESHPRPFNVQFRSLCVAGSLCCMLTGKRCKQLKNNIKCNQELSLQFIIEINLFIYGDVVPRDDTITKESSFFKNKFSITFFNLCLQYSSDSFSSRL